MTAYLGHDPMTQIKISQHLFKLSVLDDWLGGWQIMPGHGHAMALGRHDKIAS